MDDDFDFDDLLEDQFGLEDDGLRPPSPEPGEKAAKRPLTEIQPHENLQAFTSGRFSKRQRPDSSAVAQRPAASDQPDGQPSIRAGSGGDQLDADSRRLTDLQREAAEDAEILAELRRRGIYDDSQSHGVADDPQSGWLGDTPGDDLAAEAADSTAAAAAAAAAAAEAYQPPSLSAHALDGETVSVTSEYGDRAYCRVREPRRPGLVRITGAAGTTQLLPTPIAVLLRQVEEASYSRTLHASTAQATARDDDAENTGADEPLWVDKYRPRSFLDLLSDEATNRHVVKWLRSWDACVFGRNQGSNPKASAARRGHGAAPPSDSRPEQRILLLYGPPGLGKTTLAHVAARHCGYEPYEINASDDRTATSLVSRIQDASQMKSVMGSGKPNCIIVDEIDGSAGGSEAKSAVGALLKLVYGSGGGSAAEEGGAVSRGGKKPKQGQLSRPIIAICNDLYTPALRPLRARAALFQFRNPSVERLVARMKLICSSERLAADRQALSTLAERTEGDVRCCLNTLQFLSRRRRMVRSADVASTCAGHKDIAKSAFDVWQHLFWTRANKAVLRGEAPGERTQRLLGLLGDFGEPDLMMSGCHENLHNFRYRDASLEKTAGVLAALGQADALQGAMRRTGDYSLLKFLPAATLGMACVVAGPERPQLQWPKAGGEARRSQQANETLLQAVLPALQHILAPALRPIAAHLQTAEERATLCSLVDTMLGHNLRYAPGMGGTAAAAAAAGGALPLQPAVDKLCCFQGVPKSSKEQSAAQQQLVMAALQAELIRRRTVAQGGEAAESAPGEAQHTQQGARPPGILPLTVAQRAKQTLKSGSSKVPGKVRQGNWLEQLRAKKGRIGVRKQPPADPSLPPKPAATALFKFNEGYTNAVKRPVLMRELLAT